MAALNFELADDIHRRAKAAAAMAGVTLRAWLEQLIAEATKPVKAAK